MEKTISNLLMTELTSFSNKLDSYKVNSKKTSKTFSADEIEFQRFMVTVLEDVVSKIQEKINREKQANKKFRFIDRE